MSAQSLVRARPVAALVLTLLVSSGASAQSYSRPVACEDCINYWYHVDHGDQTDYTCGSETYPGHTGTDYSLRGGNSAIDDGNEVVAAAAGVVTTASDGSFDRCTMCGGPDCGVNTPGGGFANHVIVDHGTHRTIYGHMRNGSVTVTVGDSVECGQVLGHIASSGCSSGAHLHFEPRSSGPGYGEALDPYEGDCSPTETSLWVEQGPYLGMPGPACEAVEPECPPDLGTIWTCSADGTTRQRCIDGIDSTESCEWGCASMQANVDSECLLPADDDGDGARVDTDCDDANADVHPGALELCGDAIDQDCNGFDSACEMPVLGSGGSSGGGGSGGSTSGSGGASDSSGGTSGAAATGGADPAQGSGGVSGGPGGTGEQAGCQCAWHEPPSRAAWALPACLLGLLWLTRARRQGRPELE